MHSEDLTTALRGSRSTFRRAPRKWFILAISTIALGAVAPQQANAHAPGENYVWVNIDNDGVSGRFEIHIKDLKNKLNIDWEKVGGTKVEAVAATRNTVQEYLLEHFQIIVDGKPIELTFTETNVFNENGNYAQYYYEAKADVPDKITIRNDIFITSEEPLHRSLIVLEYNKNLDACLLYTSPSPRDATLSRMPSSA